MTSHASDRERAPMIAPLSVEGRRTGQGILLALFFVAVLLPINFGLGGIRMSPSRLFLLICAVPFGIRLFSGKVGGFTWIDGCVLGFSTLMVGTLAYHHGTAQLVYALSQALEIFGGYMTGRVLIRSVPDYRRFIRFYLVALLFLLPFAIDEMLHYRMLITQVLSKAFDVVAWNEQSRFDMRRAQVVFPHAILYGLFCSIPLASVFFVYRKYAARRIVYMGIVLAAIFPSLSSAPMLSASLQLSLIAWGKVTQGSWRVLAGIFAFIFVFLQMFSNRGAIAIFVTYATLSPATGWGRMVIWEWGWRSVMGHPLLGIGLNDWERVYWLPPSVDNFWLLMAMRHGLPCAAFVLLAFILHIVFLVRAKTLGEDARMLRMGYTITLFALIFILSTVHVWDSAAVFVMFFLGAGAFLYTSDQSDSSGTPAASSVPDRLVGPQFSRFPQTAGRGQRQSAQPLPLAQIARSR